uniref:Retinoic acid receptor responder 1 n=1 Tax=Felis catus TaxID=9685 RepID=A0ABI7WX67_FELCA
MPGSSCVIGCGLETRKEEPPFSQHCFPQPLWLLLILTYLIERLMMCRDMPAVNEWISFAPCGCSNPRASCRGRTTQPEEVGSMPGTELLNSKPRIVNPKKECQVDLVFTTDRYNPEEGEERLGKCSARVFFRNQKPRPAINVTCTRLIEKNKRQQEDYLLYKHMKQLKTPLDVVSIPDSHGHIDPSLRPIWDLAFLGGSYVMWEKTTQFLHYYMAQLSSVNQWKTNDDAIDFDYTVLLHEFSTQEIIPCRIHLVWYPGKPLKVKYHCQELQTPEASGTEEGSAVAPTELNNF